MKCYTEKPYGTCCPRSLMRKPLLFLLCSGSPRGGDECCPALLHLHLLRAGSVGAGRGRADDLQPLEGKQTQALLLITQQWLCVHIQMGVSRWTYDTTMQRLPLFFFFVFFYWTIQSNQLNRQRHGSEAREPWEHKEPRWTGKPAVKWFFFSVMENRIDKTCFSKKCLNVLKHAMLISTCSIMGLQRGTSRHCRFNSPVSVVMSGKD